MKTKIKQIVREYRENIYEQGGYDDDDIMRQHYSGLMNSMVSSGGKIYVEYKKLVNTILPEIIDDEISEELYENLTKLKEFLVGYDKFLENTHNKNVKKFNKKGD